MGWSVRTTDDTFVHYGVKGMKWGVRHETKVSGSKSKKRSPTAKAVSDARKRLNAMSANTRENLNGTGYSNAASSRYEHYTPADYLKLGKTMDVARSDDYYEQEKMKEENIKPSPSPDADTKNGDVRLNALSQNLVRNGQKLLSSLIKGVKQTVSTIATKAKETVEKGKKTLSDFLKNPLNVQKNALVISRHSDGTTSYRTEGDEKKAIENYMKNVEKEQKKKKK